MQDGASFKCRDLDNPDVVEFDFAPGRVRLHGFLDPKEVNIITDNDYFVPASKNVVAVDALLPAHASLFQITTAERHEVDSAGLSEALDLLPDTSEYKLYFPVPEHHYPKFGRQKLTTERGTGVPLETMRLKSVRQYALKVVLRRPMAAVVAPLPHVCLLRL